MTFSIITSQHVYSNYAKRGEETGAEMCSDWDVGPMRRDQATLSHKIA